MDPGDNDENQEKAVLVSDKENKDTFNASLKLASPSYATYWLMCSQVVLLSSPLNLTKSETSRPMGYGTKSKYVGYGF